jgi:membrane fusion protein (multidrug efflux system)
MKRLLAATGPFALAAGLAFAQSASPLPVVGYITVALTPVYDEHEYVGRIQSPQIVQLDARVTGYLESKDFIDGSAVKQGQLLYVIEQPPYQAAVDQAQAALSQAMAQAANADVTLSRASALLRTPAGQQSLVDSSKATALADAAQIEAAKAQLQTAQINLSYTEIRAPMDGQIGASAVDPGNVVGPTTGTLATIVAQDPMYVVFNVPDADALKFESQAATSGGLAGNELLVQLPNGKIYDQTGTINFINNQVTADTDTLTWRGTIANPLSSDGTRALTDGEFVTAILRSRTPQPQIVVPRDAVITDQLGDYVLTLDGANKVIRRPVTLGAQTDATAQILAGVTPGDRIITDGVQRIHPGITVQPQPAATN